METVFVLSHIHPLESENDEKLIGVYRSEEAAKSAIARAGRLPGFADCPEGFVIDAYELDRDHWTEGYVTVSNQDA
jgi:hypothetical protein